MAIKLKKDSGAQKVEAQEKSNFSPLPKGNYDVTIFDSEIAEFGPKSKNAGDPGYKLQFRVSGGEFENRRLFTGPNILLAGRWASGADNFALFQFLEAVEVPYNEKTGEVDDSEGKPLTNAEIRKMYRNLNGEIELPDPEWLLGLPLTLAVGIDKQDKDRNRINRYLVYSGGENNNGGSTAVDDFDDLEEL